MYSCWSKLYHYHLFLATNLACQFKEQLLYSITWSNVLYSILRNTISFTCTSLNKIYISNHRTRSSLQRQNTEISKQIFPEKEYRGLSPNFLINASVSDLYIPTIDSLFCWRKYVDRSWDYINRSLPHECWNWGWGRAIPRKGINKGDFSCSVYTFHGLKCVAHFVE